MAFFDFLSGVPGYFGGLMDKLNQQGFSNQLPPGTNLPQQAQGLQQAPGTAVPGQPGVPQPVNQAPGTTAPAGLLSDTIPGTEEPTLSEKLEGVLKQAQLMQALQQKEGQSSAPMPSPAPMAAPKGPLQVTQPYSVTGRRKDNLRTNPLRGFM